MFFNIPKDLFNNKFFNYVYKLILYLYHFITAKTFYETIYIKTRYDNIFEYDFDCTNEFKYMNRYRICRNCEWIDRYPRHLSNINIIIIDEQTHNTLFINDEKQFDCIILSPYNSKLSSSRIYHKNKRKSRFYSSIEKHFDISLLQDYPILFDPYVKIENIKDELLNSLETKITIKGIRKIILSYLII